ncbi:hypothetical protein ROTAS13_02462 [Roseomonas sp. TAS13]|jgi:hypothetical protein|uniref:Uncharacterized protein n=1 Tax=Muricoccus pecuniae TaxID=693023 RepID=A0A840YMQ0_9PROT|nr:hypothetical protein [Roseomonas pecuniae]MBB5696004.1 hypothetical protein [Roseomonas pecuniae]USQ74566.1 hypothetical protein NF552_25050 [Roseomonas mucosa]GAV34792.1 hypothetical protein ROTAS13_02462 [Roseomonas sp. TAS13]
MSDTKGSNQSHDTAPRRAEESALAGARSSKLGQGQASAATQYWQSVAAAGRAAKPAAAAPTEAATPGRQRGARA